MNQTKGVLQELVEATEGFVGRTLVITGRRSGKGRFMDALKAGREHLDGLEKLKVLPEPPAFTAANPPVLNEPVVIYNHPDHTLPPMIEAMEAPYVAFGRITRILVDDLYEVQLDPRLGGHYLQFHRDQLRRMQEIPK